MSSDIPALKKRYIGSFRIHLKSDASVDEVPRSSLVNIVGDVVYILEGAGEKLPRVWKFCVGGYAFGWKEYQIENILCNNAEIFSRNVTEG